MLALLRGAIQGESRLARVVTTVVGARPQFVKCSLLGRELRRRGIAERLVHTGQHYDPELSDIFIRELEIPAPDANLGIGSDSHARQTARMMIAIEDEFAAHRPEVVIVFGDTNSTLAAALVAVKMHLPLAHIEAGMRGYNRRLPEEHNRIIADHLADLLICHNERAAGRLRQERVGGRIEICGDTMRETAERFLPRALGRPLPDAVPAGRFALLTAHRPDNVDDPKTLAGILDGAGRLGMPVVFPVHPRTRKSLAGVAIAPGLILTEPVGYLEMLGLLGRAELVLTDSGGLQKEALFAGTPCVTLRGETEWPETVDLRMNAVTGNPPAAGEIAAAAQAMLASAGEDRGRRRARLAPLIDAAFGPLDVSRRIADAIESM